MVLLTFYLVGKRRFPLLSVDHYPTDWLELRMLLQEAMMTAHMEHDVTAATVSLERHLPGRSFEEPRRHGAARVPYRREYEAVVKLEFNPLTEEVDVRRASFNYTLAHVREDFWEMERGIQYRVPPLIPREHRNLTDPRTYLMEPSTTRYADYSVQPKPIYGSAKPRLSYAREAKGIYGRRRKRLGEEEEE
jgi:hypothetical protein